jgi:hypothetical protein
MFTQLSDGVIYSEKAQELKGDVCSADVEAVYQNRPLYVHCSQE